MKVKNNLLLLSFFIAFSTINAQESENQPDSAVKSRFRDRLTYNVGGGLMLGTFTNINLIPQIGYRIKPNLIAGVGANLQYIRDNFSFPSREFMVYGGNSFVRYIVNDQFFVQTEYQKLFSTIGNGDYVMAGGGYTPSRYFSISAFYLLVYPTPNIYGQPFVVRGSFFF